MPLKNIKEGSLYKSIKIEDNTFHIYYGYYSDNERELWDPAPIYPDFTKTPIFTKNGHPYSRADQDVCEYYKPKPKISGENWCNDCEHFKLCEEILGICLCDKRNDILRQNE